MTLSRQSIFEPAASTTAFRIHDDPHLLLERQVGKGRDRLAVGPGLAQLGGIVVVERRQAGDEDEVAVADAEIERAACFRHAGFDHLLVHVAP
jgi:hypothetical protein